MQNHVHKLDISLKRELFSHLKQMCILEIELALRWANMSKGTFPGGCGSLICCTNYSFGSLHCRLFRCIYNVNFYICCRRTRIFGYQLFRVRSWRTWGENTSTWSRIVFMYINSYFRDKWTKGSNPCSKLYLIHVPSFWCTVCHCLHLFPLRKSSHFWITVIKCLIQCV